MTDESRARGQAGDLPADREGDRSADPMEPLVPQPAATAARRPAPVAILSRLPLAAVNPRKLAWALAAFATVVVVVGLPQTLSRDFGVSHSPLDLNGEKNIPAALSGTVALAGAVWTLALAARLRDRRGARVLLAWAAVLVFVAVDEVVSIHERLEAWIGLDWQAIALPVLPVLVAVVVMVTRLPALRDERRLVFFGAAAAAASQVIEFFQYDEHDHLVHMWTIIPEEVLELVAFSLFAFAMLLALRRYARR